MSQHVEPSEDLEQKKERASSRNTKSDKQNKKLGDDISGCGDRNYNSTDRKT